MYHHPELNPEKALIFRITHRDNVEWILGNGLHCRNSEIADPNFVTIGNTELIDKRSSRRVKIPPGGTLSDYVPFYFTPFSPMLFNIRTGHNGITQRANEEIVILVSSLRELERLGVQFVFSDRHAYLEAAVFSSDLSELPTFVPWAQLQARNFREDPEDPTKKERYQAEALVHRFVPVAALLGVVCYSAAAKERIDPIVKKRGLGVRTEVKKRWYF